MRYNHAMPHRDAAAMLRALAQEDALRVFAAVVTVTGTGLPQRSGGPMSLRYITVPGVSRRTGLPEAAVASALTELTQAHLTLANRDGDGWCTDFHALNSVADGLSSSTPNIARAIDASRDPGVDSDSPTG